MRRPRVVDPNAGMARLAGSVLTPAARRRFSTQKTRSLQSRPTPPPQSHPPGWPINSFAILLISHAAMRYSSILLTALATSSVTLAAPSQLVLSDLVSAPDAAAVDATSGHHRDPDFVDRLEAESQRLKSVAASASSAAASPAFWPGQPNDPPGGGGWVWSSCGSPDDLVTVEAIAVSPDPPVPGKNLTVTAKGIVKGAIEVR